MQLDDEELLVRHRVEVAVQAVDHHDARTASSRPRARIACTNSPGDSSAGIDLLHADAARRPRACAESMPSPSSRLNSVFALSSKMNSAACSPRSAALRAEQRGEGRLAGARGALRSACWCRARGRRRAACRAPRRPLGRRSRLDSPRCSAATRRGNTSSPPRRIA